MVHRKETPSEKRARLLATIKFLQEPNMSDTKPHIELVEPKDNIIMIEPRAVALSELCTPPYSLLWRVYNRIAGKIDCSCCVFWRGFILSTMLWGWVGILITTGLLIFGK
jgi:hypothetical protein